MNGEDLGFSSAKLREFVAGRVKENRDLYPHTGLTEPGGAVESLLSFGEAAYSPDGARLPGSFAETAFASILRRSEATTRVGAAVPDLPNYAVGMTEKDVEIGAAQAVGRMLSSLYNEGAAYIGTMFGAPKRGKTGLAALLCELWLEIYEMKYALDPGGPEPVVITNMRTLRPPVETHYVEGIDGLEAMVFGDNLYRDSNGDSGTAPELAEDRPKWFHFDEVSTHLDARTFRREVPEQYTPLLKRFGKVRMDSVHIGHSGLDVHPELRRETISTEFIFKTSKKEAEVFERMNEHRGAGLKYRLEAIPETKIPYDPTDFSPWEWRKT